MRSWKSVQHLCDRSDHHPKKCWVAKHLHSTDPTKAHRVSTFAHVSPKQSPLLVALAYDLYQNSTHSENAKLPFGVPSATVPTQDMSMALLHSIYIYIYIERDRYVYVHMQKACCCAESHADQAIPSAEVELQLCVLQSPMPRMGRKGASVAYAHLHTLVGAYVHVICI